jgi:hypothetical protein
MNGVKLEQDMLNDQSPSRGALVQRLDATSTPSVAAVWADSSKAAFGLASTPKTQVWVKLAVVATFVVQVGNEVG